MPTHTSTQLVKVNGDGVLRLEIPSLAGQYLFIEQHDGCVVLRPFSLDADLPEGAIVRHGNLWTLLGDPARNEVEA